ncbi:MAG: exonuclease domain-containing protein [Oleiphilaceae bacterium]|nr:exonuclease domain-containing protein [Oleiphilaceae bacterium]
MDKLAFIDIETTGGRAGSDRITEIAIRVIEGEQELTSWQSLINPQSAIPLFIQRLTGIDDDMVADAPLFEQVADEVERLTQGCVFVAHNARFDYAFFKQEFKRLGRSYSRRVLCTVKLAKLLYPQYQGHGMDKLIARHQLPCEARHRAMGDVNAMLAFYRFAEQDVGAEAFDQAVKKLLKRPALPAALTEEDIQAVPEAPGVYYFYGENRVLLYVGKSVNLYQRVLSHFSADHQSQKEMVLSQSLRSIAWQTCAGEMDAMLQEIADIKGLQPVHNRRLRPVETYFAYELQPNDQGYLVPRLAPITLEPDHDGRGLERFTGICRSKGAASKALQSWFNKNDLCARLMGLDHGAGPCFARQLQQCQGACTGDEDPERYNLRLQIAIFKDQLKAWPFEGSVLIKEVSKASQKTSAFLVDNWCVLARFRSEAGESLEPHATHDMLENVCAEREFDADVYRVLQRFIAKPHGQLSIVALNGGSAATG